MLNLLIDKFLMLDWNGMFIPTLSILEKIIRPIIVYFLLIIIIKLAGKRELVQLNTFDFVVLLMISNVVQNAIIGNDNSISGGIIGAISLIFINFLVTKFLYNHQKLDKIIEGESDILINNGIINEKSLNKEFITIQDLELAAHKQGIVTLDEVEKAELDTDGEIFFITKIPTPEIKRHKEIIEKINHISNELENLKKELKK
jgi:uncharacterized membrane protein YcaP (DUF421 family)